MIDWIKRPLRWLAVPALAVGLTMAAEAPQAKATDFFSLRIGGLGVSSFPGPAVRGGFYGHNPYRSPRLRTPGIYRSPYSLHRVDPFLSAPRGRFHSYRHPSHFGRRGNRFCW